MTVRPARGYGSGTWDPLLLALALVAPAKSTDTELTRLRHALGLTPEATLRLSSRGELPPATSRQVGLATGLDTKVRDNLTRWTDEWNRKDGAKAGRLTLVEDLGEAQVVLVRLLDEDKAKSTTQTFVTPSADPAALHGHHAPATLVLHGLPGAPSTRTCWQRSPAVSRSCGARWESRPSTRPTAPGARCGTRSASWPSRSAEAARRV